MNTWLLVPFIALCAISGCLMLVAVEAKAKKSKADTKQALTWCIAFGFLAFCLWMGR